MMMVMMLTPSPSPTGAPPQHVGVFQLPRGKQEVAAPSRLPALLPSQRLLLIG